MDRIRGLNPLLVIGIVAFGRELLVLCPVKLGEGRILGFHNRRRHPWPRSKPCSASEPGINPRPTNRYVVRPIFLSRPRRADTYWGLLKLPDKQKLAGDWGGDSRRSGLIDFSDFTVKREVP